MMYLGGTGGPDDESTRELMRDIESSSDEDVIDKNGNVIKRVSLIRKKSMSPSKKKNA